MKRAEQTQRVRSDEEGYVTNVTCMSWYKLKEDVRFRLQIDREGGAATSSLQIWNPATREHNRYLIDRVHNKVMEDSVQLPPDDEYEPRVPEVPDTRDYSTLAPEVIEEELTQACKIMIVGDEQKIYILIHHEHFYEAVCLDRVTADQYLAVVET
ncbi:MAG: hypothetical protein AAB776_00715 [Patescibacteria group bacterium]